MDVDFVRNRLFQPFASTKQGGFGIGAFEARSLLVAMGGRVPSTAGPARAPPSPSCFPARRAAGQDQLRMSA